MKALPIAAIFLASLGAALPQIARATSYAPIPLNDLRALSQSADAVVVARVQNFVPGRPTRKAPDGAYIKDTAATFICAVEKTLAGSISLVGQRRFFYSGGDFYSWKETNALFLFFVRHTKTGYELCGAPMELRNGALRGWYEGKDSPADLYTLQELLPLIKKNIATKVQFSGWVPSQVAATTGVLPTAWTFKNVGSSAIFVLPPSLCFNSLVSRHLRDGQWYSDLYPWQSVDHWEFYSKQQHPVWLAPGKQRTFYYKVPLSQLKMTSAGQYEMTFQYHQSQLSQHAKGAGINPAQMHDIWLGEPPRTTQSLRVVAE